MPNTPLEKYSGSNLRTWLQRKYLQQQPLRQKRNAIQWHFQDNEHAKTRYFISYLQITSRFSAHECFCRENVSMLKKLWEKDRNFKAENAKHNMVYTLTPLPGDWLAMLYRKTGFVLQCQIYLFSSFCWEFACFCLLNACFNINSYKTIYLV